MKMKTMAFGFIVCHFWVRFLMIFIFEHFWPWVLGSKNWRKQTHLKIQIYIRKHLWQIKKWNWFFSPSPNDYHLGVQLLLSFEIDVLIFSHMRAKIARIVLTTIFSTKVTLGQGDFGKKIGGETLLVGDLIPCDRVKDEVCNCVSY